MPTNNQIDVALNSFLATDFMNADSTWNRRLSEEGHGLLKDFAGIVENAKILVLTKNYDNLFQDFVWHSSKMNIVEGHEPGLTTTGTGDTEKDSATLYDHDVIKGLRDLGTLIITNGQFRKLLSDGITLLRDMAADIGTGAAGKIRPSGEQMAKIDEPAAEDTWHQAPDYGKVGQTLGALKKENLNRDKLRQAREEHAEEIDKAKKTQDERVDRAKDYLDKKLSKERRDQVLFRLKKMVVEIQGHPDYQNAIDSILDLAESYKGHVGTAADQSQSKVKKISENDHLQLAQRNLKILIERFANNTSLDDLLDNFTDLYVDANNDPILKGWFRDLDAYVRKVLKQQGYIMSDAANDEFNEIYNRGNDIFSHRYSDYPVQFHYEFNYLSDKFQADPLNKQFGDSVTTLFTDLCTDEKGEVVFKKHLVKDITDVILPELFEKTRYVPLPRIERSGPDLDVVIENLVIESGNFVPNVLEIQDHSVIRWGRKAISKGKRGKFIVNVSGIECDFKDACYYVHKKTGYPSIRDTGIADFFLGKEGISIKMHLSTAESKNRNSFFNVDNVEVKIKDLEVKLKKSNHKFLFTIFRPLLIAVAKPGLKRVLQKQIRETFDQLDETAYKIHLNKKRIAADMRQNPDVEKEPSALQMYLDAAKSEILREKEKKREMELKGTKPEVKVKVAMTRDDTILKNIVLPTGYTSTTATMFKKMAAEGDRWKSKVFSIGTAAPSTEFTVPVEMSRRSRREAAQNVDIANAPSKPTAQATEGEAGGQRDLGTDASATRSAGSANVAAGLGSGAAASGKSRVDSGQDIGITRSGQNE
ncbi:uncharacterized protein V1513DRAFT_446467 [Lipomyces chichibuensis]|uniref:uncharacterized protein n=1 Tax=Lipomyces chichibuensis TaxID=1546026 RepID=UPI0033441790